MTEREKLVSLNIIVTEDIFEEMAREGNRSKAVRRVLAAILAAASDGETGPIEAAADAALRTNARNRNLVRDIVPSWKKAIIWIPERMCSDLQARNPKPAIKPADLIRGALVALKEESSGRKFPHYLQSHPVTKGTHG